MAVSKEAEETSTVEGTKEWNSWWSQEVFAADLRYVTREEAVGRRDSFICKRSFLDACGFVRVPVQLA